MSRRKRGRRKRIDRRKEVKGNMADKSEIFVFTEHTVNII